MPMSISLLGRILDLIAPRSCAVCGCRLSPDEQAICIRCNLHLPRTHYEKVPYDNEMARLFWKRIPLEKCAAWFFFQAGSEAANILYRLKYHHHPETAEAIGLMIGQEWKETGFFENIDLLIPVPLAHKRERQRGYNQSMEITKGIHQATGIPIGKNIILRNRFVESQTHIGRWERADNVEGVFELIDAAAIHGKHVLLIDDVVTTGATITACGQELAKAGDIRISVLSIGFAKE